MKITSFIRKLQYPLTLALGGYGFTVLVCCYYAPVLLPYRWAIPAAYFALTVLSMLLPEKLRLPMGILGGLALPVVSMLLFREEGWIGLLLIALIHGLLLLWSVRIGSWSRGVELPGMLLGIGFLILLVAGFLATYSEFMVDVRGSVKASLFIYTLLALLSMNRDSWALAAAGKQKFSASMRGKNILMTLGVFAAATLAALIPSIANLVSRLADWIAMFLAWLMELFEKAKETVDETTEAIMETQDMLGVGTEVPKDDRFWIVIQIVAIVLMVLLGAFLVWKLGKYLVKLSKRLYKKVTEIFTMDSGEFQDEIMDIREELEQQKKRRVQTRKSAASVKKMSPGEKVRYRYLRLQQKHQWERQYTARENLPDSAAQIYEQVRYSAHPVTEADAERFQTETTAK